MPWLIPHLTATDGSFLFLGLTMVIFNRSFAHFGVEGQIKIYGMKYRDPVQSKRITGYCSAAMGLFFMIFALIHGISGHPVSLSQETDLPVLAGIGMLGLAIELIVFRKTVVRLTTEQASEILRTNVSEDLINYVVIIFHSLWLLWGSVIVGTAIMRS